MVTSSFAANNAARFNPGTPNDYISLGLNAYNPLFSGAPGLTFEGWVKPASIPSEEPSRIFDIFTDGKNSAFALEIGIDGSLSAMARSRKWETLPVAKTGPDAIVAGNWYHIAVVVSYSPKKYIHIYINGIAAVENDNPGFANSSYVSFEWGSSTDIGNNADVFGRHVEYTKLPYVGLMDEFRFWTYARSISEIQADMNRELPAPYDPRLIGYWNFNEGTGTTAHDISGNGKNGTLLDGTDWTDGNPTLPVELSSFSVALNGTNQAVLTWVTQTETGVSGFYVYRNTENDLASAELISNLIPATNTSQQIVYVFRDKELTTPGTYHYWLQIADLDGSESYHGPVNLVYVGGNNQQSPGIPEITTLKDVYPNPFNPSTTISYGLDKAASVSIKIYNSRGQIVHSIAEGMKNAGNHNLVWNGNDHSGKSLPTGVYYIRMQAGDKTFNKKAVLMK